MSVPVKPLTAVAPNFEAGLSRTNAIYSPPPAGPTDVLLIGDSLAERFPAAELPGRSVTNLGVGGDRTENVLWRLQTFPHAALAPRRVILFIGLNNIWEGDRGVEVGLAVGQIRRNLEALWPQALVTVVTIPPFGPGLDFNEAERQAANASTREAGGGVLDLDELIASWPGHGAERFHDQDMIHISPDGYRAIAEALFTEAAP